MSEFKVDIQAMAALVESLNSFEEKMKEYDVEDWVPNSGMLENPDVWDPTNAFQDTWEKGLADLREDIRAAGSAVGGALGAYGEYRGHDRLWVLLHMAHQYSGSAATPAAFPRALR